jgi:hypothetical protein
MHSACLLLRPEFSGRFVAAFMFRFASGLFLVRFFTRAFLSILFLTRPFFTLRLGTAFPRRFVARRLEAAQGPPKVFNLPFVVKLLFLRQFDQFQNVLHLLEGFFERFYDPADLVRSSR